MVLDLRMSDADLQASSDDGPGSSSIKPPPCPQRSQRIDYHLLNGRSDEEEIEDHIRKKPRLDPPLDHLESIDPEDSASQLHLSTPTPSDSVPQGSSGSLPEAKQPYKPHIKPRIKPTESMALELVSSQSASRQAMATQPKPTAA